MTKWTSISRSDVTPAPGAPRLHSGTATHRRLSPGEFPLWMVETTLDDGAALRWDGEPGDEAVYVHDGALEVDGAACVAGGAVIVERDARSTVTAQGPTTVLHCGSRPDAAPRPGPLGPSGPGGHVHVVDPSGRFVSGSRENVHAVWFADGTCETCRLQLFTVRTPADDDRRGRAHSHSQDEIICLLDGKVSMGAHTFGPGTAVSIPGDVRYALTAHEGGHRFLNFRRDVSVQIYELGSEPLLETASARGGRATADD